MMDFEVQGPATSEVTKYELERKKPAPSRNHGAIQANLIFELSAYRKEYNIASELDLDLNNWKTVPDISILPPCDLDLNHDIIVVKEPPLCVIEILCPTQSLTDITSKIDVYFQHGVQSFWIVLPPLASIYVYSSPDDYAIFRASETLVDKKLDISFSLAEVFK